MREKASFLRPRIGLFPAVRISTREINKLSEDELMKISKLGLSLIGVRGFGMRSAIYAIKKNKEQVLKKLDEKNIKYRITTTFAPIFEGDESSRFSV